MPLMNYSRRTLKALAPLGYSCNFKTNFSEISTDTGVGGMAALT